MIMKITYIKAFENPTLMNTMNMRLKVLVCYLSKVAYYQKFFANTVIFYCSYYQRFLVYLPIKLEEIPVQRGG